jgi:hypothetical protein
VKRFGRDGAVFLLGIRDDIRETLTFLAPETPPPPAQNGAHKARGRPFEPVKSGNPNGRPKATMAMEELLDGEAEALTRKLLDKALEGDIAALRLCLDRLLPPRRDRPVVFELPKIESAKDALAASAAILAASAAGKSSPSEAAELMGLLAIHVRMFEVTETEAGLAALEEELEKRMPSP